MGLPSARMRTLLISFAACLAVSLATPAFAEEVVLEDLWYSQFHGPAKTGWSHHRRVRSMQNGRPVIVTESESELIRGPDGELLANPMRFRSRFVEDESGAVLAYATSADIGMGPQIREGRVENGVIHAVADGQTQEVPYPAGALGPAAVDRAVAAAIAPRAKIETLRFQPLDPEKGEKLRWEVPETTELVDVLGIYGWLYVVKMTDSTGLPETRLLDGKGNLWGGSLNLGQIRYFLTEEVVARADRESVSFLTERIVAPDRVIPPSARRSRVVLRLSREEGPLGDLPTSRYQMVHPPAEDGSVQVELSPAEPEGDLVVWARPYGGEEEAGYLAPTPIVESGYDRLQKCAQAWVGPLQDALSCARVLELRTKQFVRPAPADVGFSTAAWTISSATGDSTETAVLIVALARTLGLPARLVAGFTYWAPEEWPDGRHPTGAFAPHVWAEIYVGEDLWHPVDPMCMDGTVPEQRVSELEGHGGVGATHVAVLRSAGDTTRPFTDIVLPVLEFMRGLNIEVVEPKE